MNNQEFFNQVSKNTGINYHTENYLLIAEHYNLPEFIDIFKAIKIIHETEGHLPNLIFEYRNKKLNEMLLLLPAKDVEKLDI